jgi:hypothetical protein
MEQTIKPWLTSKHDFPAPKRSGNGLAIGLVKAEFREPAKKAANPHAGFEERLMEACESSYIPNGRRRSAARALRTSEVTEAAHR